MADMIHVLHDSEVGVSVGERVRLVCQGMADRGDPFAYLNGEFVVFKADPDISTGDVVDAVVADIQANKIVAVVDGDGGGG